MIVSGLYSNRRLYHTRIVMYIEEVRLSCTFDYLNLPSCIEIYIEITQHINFLACVIFNTRTNRILLYIYGMLKYCVYFKIGQNIFSNASGEQCCRILS